MNPDPSIPERNAFYQSMTPHWDDLTKDLAAQCPPEWQGFVFDVSAARAANEDRLNLSCEFRDGRSNRKGSVSKNIPDRIAELYFTYFDFSPALTWKEVSVQRLWDREKNTWVSTIKFVYD